ncbi:P-loop containing nucleoside triphosphate hydrolase protein [Dactylonectria macrodidyma]|uniref:Peroxisomal ATPase PEX1 n=1 Tax=Dactylonectria macrodidyma TaxID=307937 RepID=A0A9P9EW85_9HYPO|nr:P-loop containing nucleoside triphosphate hydrolase protein [Dactylonectria macrodidyma]
MGSKRPVTLRSSLDRDVYQILKKLEDANDGRPFKGITPAYEAIKRSNSSLSRQKKRPLEDSIDRVLQFRKQELDESDSEADLEEAEPVKPDDDRFLLNRQMTKHWHLEPAPQAPNSSDGPIAKKRRLQVDGEERTGGNESSTSVPALTPAPSTGQAETDAIPAEKLKKTHPKKAQRSSRYKVEHPSNAQRLAGVSEIYDELLDHAFDILKRPELYIEEGWRQCPGILLSGPSGVGKKSLICSLVSDLEVPMVSLKGCLSDPERMERSLNDAIEEAMRLAPCIIFIEQLDLYVSNPGANSHSDHHQRMLLEIQQQMLRIQQEQPKDRPILAIATTSRIADVDPAALKLGFFEQTIEMKVPDLEARRDIFKVVTEGMKLAEDIDFVELARITHGFVGADIVNIGTLAPRVARRRIKQNEDSRRQTLSSEEQIPALEAMEISSEIVPSTVHGLPSHHVSLGDFKTAIEGFTPSLRKHGFTSIPSVTWSQVGALRDVREQLNMSIVGPIKFPDLYQSVGLNSPAGCLIWGPPGCGKTLVAQAIANEAQASFILINGPELLNKYVGESERAVRELFNRARSSAPCILFFDEMDSIVPKRDNASTESGTRVVNALLTELDGAQGRAGVYVIGTTNRPDMIDDAMLRPGRLSVKLFVDIPTADERVDILKAVYRTNHRDSSPEELANLDSIALDPRCDGFSGADLGGLHTKAGESALKRWFKGETGGKSKPEIGKADWEYALASTRRSVPNPDTYRRLERVMRESN